MNVKAWLVTLCLAFTLGMGILFFSNMYISKLVLDDITLPQIPLPAVLKMRPARKKNTPSSENLQTFSVFSPMKKATCLPTRQTERA